jgi:uncharacterized phiE125 gp8 family phage protein
MPVTIDPNALVSIDTVRRLVLDDPDDVSKDDVLTELINGCTGAIEDFCGRKFKQRTYTDEQYSGSGGKVLYLKQYPVSSVTSVRVLDDDDNEETIEVTRKDLEAGMLYSPNSYWPKGDMNILASYTAGYGTIPSNLSLACALLVEFYYKLSVADFSSVFGEGNVTIRPEAFPGKVKSLIGPYKRVRV